MGHTMPQWVPGPCNNAWYMFLLRAWRRQARRQKRAFWHWFILRLYPRLPATVVLDVVDLVCGAVPAMQQPEQWKEFHMLYSDATEHTHSASASSGDRA